MIPDTGELALPVLQEAAKGEFSRSSIGDRLAQRLKLTEEDLQEKTLKGNNRFGNNINFAVGDLKREGWIKKTSKGLFRATEDGKRVLAENPERLQIQEKHIKRGLDKIVRSDGVVVMTLDKNLPSSRSNTDEALVAELTEFIRKLTPSCFERLILKLLHAMEYGSGRVIGKSGDDGVDGVINQDPLGMDQIYFQAKCYNESNKVGPSAIRDFFGALNLRNSQKGIFFATSEFSLSAQETAKNLGARVVLVDGKRLAKLMINYNVGLCTVEATNSKEIDERFFDEDL